MEFIARPHAKFCLTRTGNRKSIWSGLMSVAAVHVRLVIFPILFRQKLSYSKHYSLESSWPYGIHSCMQKFSIDYSNLQLLRRLISLPSYYCSHPSRSPITISLIINCFKLFIIDLTLNLRLDTES